MNQQKLTSKNAIKWTCIQDPSGIRLPGYTWNPIGGCLHNCQWTMPDGTVATCYAEDAATRIAKNSYPHGFQHHYFHPKRLQLPLKLKTPSGIFLDSMSDLMGHWVPDDHIDQVLEIVKLADWHIFQLLTKNAPRLLKLDFPANVWIGVSSPPDHMWGRALTDDQKRRMLTRSLDVLAEIDDRTRWMSFEPLSWDVSDIVGAMSGALDWAVIGAASNGRTKYPPDDTHLRNLLDVLDDQNVPVFFKGNLHASDYANQHWREEFPAGGATIYSNMPVRTPFGHTGVTGHLTETGWQVKIDIGDTRIYPSYNLTPRIDLDKIVAFPARIMQGSTNTESVVGTQRAASDPEPTTYTYLGDKLTAPVLKGMPCNPVRREDGKCVVGQCMATQLVEDQTGTKHIVLRRRLRLTAEEKAHRQLEQDIAQAHAEWPTLRLSDFVIFPGDTIRCPDGHERKVLSVSPDGYEVTYRTKTGQHTVKRIAVHVTDRQYPIPNIGDSLPIPRPSSVIDISQKGITVRFLCNIPEETTVSDRRYHVTYRIEEYYHRAHPILGPEPPTTEQHIAALRQDITRLQAENDHLKALANHKSQQLPRPMKSTEPQPSPPIHRDPPPVDQILVADALAYLQRCEDNSVHCMFTSPPYLGLRKYGDVEGQIGEENSLDEYLDSLRPIFAEIQRVLRPDGTLFVNMGDSHANDSKWGGATGGKHVADLHGNSGIGRRKMRTGLKPKDLMGQPWLLAFALRELGFTLRADILWHKPDPMPTSATDRVTIAHEYIFHFANSCTTQYWTHRDRPGTRTKPKPDYRWIDRLTGEETGEPPENWKSEMLPDGKTKRWRRINLWTGHDYWYDGMAIREPTKPDSLQRYQYGFAGSFTPGSAYPGEKREQPHSWQFDQSQTTRNKRSVWTIATKGYKHAHFATFPEELAKTILLAGCPPKVCAQCRAPWERMIEKSFIPQQDVSLERGIKGANGQKPQAENNQWGGVPRGSNHLRSAGWQPTCDCDAEPIPGIVLDPFMGSGTVALVAQKNNRRFMGCDLNPDYVQMATLRLQNREDEIEAEENDQPFTHYMFPTTHQEVPASP